MRYIVNIYNATKKCIKNSPLTSVFLIFGLILSMLTISIGVSFVAEHMNVQKERDEQQPPNGQQYSIQWQEKIETDVFNKLFDGIRNDTGIIVNGLTVHLDEGEVNTYTSVSAEWFTSDGSWHYPILEGRYYTEEEIDKGEYVALIGKGLREYTYEEDGKEYISIEGEKYQVVGIVGTRQEISSWDRRLFIPCTALPERLAEGVSAVGFNFIMYNEASDFDMDVDVIIENSKKIASDANFLSYGAIESGDVAAQLAGSNEMIYTIAAVGYLVSLVYAINIAAFWIAKRKKEIATRKAVGYKNREIVKLLVMEMLGYSTVSCVMAIGIQYILKLAMDTLAGYSLNIYLSNIIIGVVMILLTTMITTLLPIRKMLKIQPIEAMKK